MGSCDDSRARWAEYWGPYLKQSIAGDYTGRSIKWSATSAALTGAEPPACVCAGRRGGIVVQEVMFGRGNKNECNPKHNPQINYTAIRDTL